MDVKTKERNSMGSSLLPYSTEQLPRRQRPRLRQVLEVLVVACILLQTLRTLPGLWNLSSKLNYGRSMHSMTLDPADEWKDDTWPIRQPTPWDISTDFPYPGTIEFDTEEGTWLRLDVHPITGEIVFDMLGDLYCLPANAYMQENYPGHVTEAYPFLLGVPYDSDPHFSPDGKYLAFRSDAELGVENIWLVEWKGCWNMNVRTRLEEVQGEGDVNRRELHEALRVKKEEEDLLVTGVKETVDRKRRRLLREGRLSARRVTNETYRWVSDPRFGLDGTKIIATKWYTSSRSLGAGEGWEYDIPEENANITVGAGKRIVGRKLAPGWSSERYGDQQVGPEQFIWLATDTLIYSQNVEDTKGRWTYSKDIHNGIYAILSYNLTSGQTKTLVDSFPGGASRPELSRDKRTLAFVRRVRDKEALVLKDLATGTLDYVFFGLTYDLTTVSAPMGTYPSFAFTPNDDAIIIWAAGKIWRVPLTPNEFGERVASGEPHVIPFRAHVEKKKADTRHTNVDLVSLETADEQRQHAFRDLSVDHAGKRVVFQAAGVSYYLDLTTGKRTASKKARKVPVIHSGQAYYSPSFVPENSALVIHARWSDTNFTAFELADISSNSAIDISEGLPLGRYDHPTLCECSGKRRKIAFVKTGGDLLTGDTVATANPGLYIGEITLPDSISNLDAKRVSIPIRDLRYIPSQIDPRDRISLRFLHGKSKLLVQQSSEAFVIDLAGGSNELGEYNTTSLAEGAMSQELAVSVKSSSDAKKVETEYTAFVDFFNVYVIKSKLVNDKPLWSKPGVSPKGLARVSFDGGHDIAWSLSGKRLFWFLGPYLHSLEVSKLEKCKSEINDDTERFGITCVRKLLDVHDVYVSYPTDVSRLKKEAKAASKAWSTNAANADVVAITNATIITMETRSESQDVLEGATLLIRGGVIEKVDHSRNVDIPDGATVFNAQGGFILPGFIDVHAHWSGVYDPYPARSWELNTFLAYGVTTLHNPSSGNVIGYIERGRVESGRTVGPRIFHTGNVIYGAGGPGIHNDVADLEDARSALIRIKAEGGPASFSYKNYNQYSRASRQRLLLASRELNMLCVPEGGMNQDWDLTYIIDGMTTVEHALPVSQLYHDVLRLFAYSGTGYTPTHVVNYGGAFGEQLVWAFNDVPNDPKLRRFTRHDILEGLSETSIRPENSYALFNTSASAAKLVDSGLRVHIGAHGEPPLGLNYHAEMFFTGLGGLSNYKVYRAATIDAAWTLGLSNSLGSISPGKLADFVVYPPGVDILSGHSLEVSKNILYVARGGRIWEAETMTEVWPVKGRKAPLPPINAD